MAESKIRRAKAKRDKKAKEEQEEPCPGDKPVHDGEENQGPKTRPDEGAGEKPGPKPRPDEGAGEKPGPKGPPPKGGPEKPRRNGGIRNLRPKGPLTKDGSPKLRSEGQRRKPPKAMLSEAPGSSRRGPGASPDGPHSFSGSTEPEPSGSCPSKAKKALRGYPGPKASTHWRRMPSPPPSNLAIQRRPGKNELPDVKRIVSPFEQQRYRLSRKF
jgi:hypothetical protein